MNKLITFLCRGKEDEQYYRRYLIGILVTFGFGIFKLIFALLALLFDSKIIKNINDILAYEIASIILLFFSAWVIIYMGLYAVKKKANEQLNHFYKEYIQLEGYLQTLISFFIAIIGLIPLNEDDVSIGRIAFPIGMALITSILGWFFGAHICPPTIENKSKYLTIEEETNKLKQAIIELVDVTNVARNSVQENIVNLLDGTKKLIEDQNSALARSKKVQEELHSLNIGLTKDLKITLSEILLELKDYHGNLEKNVTVLTRNIFAQQDANQKELVTLFELFLKEILHLTRATVDEFDSLKIGLVEFIVGFQKEADGLNIGFTNLIERMLENKDLIIFAADGAKNSMTDIRNILKDIRENDLNGFYQNSHLEEDINKIHKIIEEQNRDKKRGILARLFGR